MKKEFPDNFFSETGKSSETAVVLARGEYKILGSLDTSHPEFLEAMKRHGFNFDQGDVWVEVEGKKFKISTSRDDFGTMAIEND